MANSDEIVTGFLPNMTESAQFHRLSKDDNQFKPYWGSYAMTVLRTKFGYEFACRSSQPIYIGDNTLICAGDAVIGMHLTPYEHPVKEGGHLFGDLSNSIPHPYRLSKHVDIHKLDAYNFGMIIGLDIDEKTQKTFEIHHRGLRHMLPPCKIEPGVSTHLIFKGSNFAQFINKSVEWRLELLAGILDVSMNLMGSQNACIQMRHVTLLSFIGELMLSLGCPSSIKSDAPVSTLAFRLSDFLKLIKLGLPVKYFQVKSVENPVDVPPPQDMIISVEHTYVRDKMLYTFEKSQKLWLSGFLIQV